MITSIKKRDGREVSFDCGKIAIAIQKAFEATHTNSDDAELLAEEVANNLNHQGLSAPDVEQIQDMVERVLMDHGHIRTAIA